ncbi:hypothetical protein VaNZ11_004441 [Volvox africanus]|uniref:Uncharacterized protein n=1 Tax=Volvox africanus TaxID=51714 RepID=A0ABQ5RWG3_9CHLO|nr:hypothetical protein VaNZ11_004441 [Volvox africanus]
MCDATWSRLPTPSGMLVGDDKRLYGATFPVSPLGVYRMRPHSATPAFRPLSSSTSSHNPHTFTNVNANSTNDPLNNFSNNPDAQLHQASSTPQDHGSAGWWWGCGSTECFCQPCIVVCQLLVAESRSGPSSPSRTNGGWRPTSRDDGDRKGKCHPVVSPGQLQQTNH